MAHRSTATSRVIFCVSLAVGVAGASLPARAYDDGYQNVFSSVLTAMGLMPPEKAPEIEYRERPPLVLPPKTALVKPVDAGAARPAAWPQDPDVIRRRKADEEAKAPPEYEFSKSFNGPLSKDELMKGRAAPTAESEVDIGGRCGGFHHTDRSCVLSPTELQAIDERYRAANPDKGSNVLTAGAEPEREYLTQPPRGYMKATKSIKVTHEAPEPKIDVSNPSAQLVYRPRPSDE